METGFFIALFQCMISCDTKINKEVYKALEWNAIEVKPLSGVLSISIKSTLTSLFLEVRHFGKTIKGSFLLLIIPFAVYLPNKIGFPDGIYLKFRCCYLCLGRQNYVLYL